MVALITGSLLGKTAGSGGWACVELRLVANVVGVRRMVVVGVWCVVCVGYGVGSDAGCVVVVECDVGGGGYVLMVLGYDVGGGV